MSRDPDPETGSIIAGIVQTEHGIQPHANDDEAIVEALRHYEFDLSYAEISMWHGPSDRAAFRERRRQVQGLLDERAPGWRGTTFGH